MVAVRSEWGRDGRCGRGKGSVVASAAPGGCVERRGRDGWDGRKARSKRPICLVLVLWMPLCFGPAIPSRRITHNGCVASLPSSPHAGGRGKQAAVSPPSSPHLHSSLYSHLLRCNAVSIKSVAEKGVIISTSFISSLLPHHALPPPPPPPPEPTPQQPTHSTQHTPPITVSPDSKIRKPTPLLYPADLPTPGPTRLYPASSTAAVPSSSSTLASASFATQTTPLEQLSPPW